MNAPLRRGHCPTLSAPMQTGDGLLARLNPVASGLSLKILIRLCKAAMCHGNGIVEVTARGSLQIRGLTTASAEQLTVEVDALGIEVRNGVPIETGALAGLDPDEIADPRPLAERIRAAIPAKDLESRLGPKVSVVVDGGGHSGMDAVTADVRLTAERDDDGVVWRLAVAGNAATAIPLGDFARDAACDAALAILGAVAVLGRAGRARDLSANQISHAISASGIADRNAPPSVLPDISPSRGEIGSHQRLRQSPTSRDERRQSGRPISPLEGEMSGRTEGGNVGREHARLLADAIQINAASTNNRGRLFDILPLTDGRFALTVALPFGHVHATHLIDFIQAAETLRATEIRLAPQRTLILLCPSEAAATAIRDAAGQAGLVVDADDPRSRVAACPGSPACASGHIPARAIAAEVAKTLPPGFDLNLHVSGCEKRCAKPGHDGLTLLGLSDGAGLVVEAWDGQPLACVAKEQTVAAIGRVATLIAAERNPGESEAACLVRIGKTQLAQAFVRES